MVESIVAVLACTRIGAVYVVLAGRLDARELAARLVDCGAVAVLTGDGTRHDVGHVPPKVTLDKALDMAGPRSRVRLVLVVTTSGAEVPMKAGRDHRYDAVVDWYEPDCPPEAMYEDDPLFVLYPMDRQGEAGAVTCTVGKYRRLTSCATEMLYPQAVIDVSAGLITQAWNGGRTSQLLGLLARGGTLAIAEDGPANGLA
ncbi:AMP-binding protein [Komagataeibacter kakiaceti]|uniref:AMP-binding protein n=1 Tax=Komagataeibacter kakiaceti TaxID=943261 RepID=UPI000AD15463|nr:AMP-binding protein [Komagataeibacter kakiaceti]